MTNAAHLRTLAASAFLLVACSCTITINPTDEDARWRSYNDDPALGVTVASFDGEDGGTTSYSVSGQTQDFPADEEHPTATVVTTTASAALHPHLGLEVDRLDTETAAREGVEPWKGVLVSTVEEGSAAEVAGIQRGDVIIAMRSTRIVSPEQFLDTVLFQLEVGQRVPFELLREVGGAQRQSVVVGVVIGSESVESMGSEREEFDLDRALIHSTGMGVFDPGPELYARMFGDARPAPLVAAVVVGSPAYLAGVRAGDRVLVAEGVQMASVEDLRERVQGLGSGKRTLALKLDGPLGPHGASFEVRPDVLEESDFHIPVLVDYEKRPHRRSLSVLDFIFQFGFSKRTRYAVSTTREPSKSSRLSILPLGMFEFSRTETEARNRIFWLIRWSSH